MLHDSKIYLQNQKYYTGVRTTALNRVFITVLSTKLASPDDFRLSRMENQNKVIPASLGKGVIKTTESKYSPTHSVHSCIPFLFPVQLTGFPNSHQYYCTTVTFGTIRKF